MIKCADATSFYEEQRRAYDSWGRHIAATGFCIDHVQVP